MACVPVFLHNHTVGTFARHLVKAASHGVDHRVVRPVDVVGHRRAIDPVNRVLHLLDPDPAVLSRILGGHAPPEESRLVGTGTALRVQTPGHARLPASLTGRPCILRVPPASEEAAHGRMHRRHIRDGRVT